MPTMSEDQRHALLVYLNIEGVAKMDITELDNDIVDLLNDNNYTIPTYKAGPGTGNPMFGGNKTYSSHMIKLWKDSNIQTWMGLASLAEANNYTRHITSAGASTGNSKGVKNIDVPGVPNPVRRITSEYFDHNGMMARNILSIASTGMPDPSWIVAAKKVAAGANYLSEFPANLRDTYALGSRGVHPNMGVSKPAPVAVPIPVVVSTPAAPAPAPVAVSTPIEETVVEEVLVTAHTGTTYLGTGDAVKTALKTVRSNGRSLNDATWASYESTKGGMYPYDTNKQPLEIIFKQHANNNILQPPVTGKNMGTLDLFSGLEIVAEVNASPAAKIVIQDRSVFIDINSEKYLLAENVTVEVVWERSTDNITGVVVKHSIGELIRIVNNKISSLNIEDTPDETILNLVDAPADIWVAPEILYDFSEINNPVVYIGYQRDNDYGISSVSSPRDDYNAALDEIRDGGYGFGYFSTEVTIKGSLVVYEGGSDENHWLSRIVVETSDTLDFSKTYIVVNLVFDTDTSSTTDLYNGGSETKREETLIFPGDENSLDLFESPYSKNKTIIAAIGIDSAVLRLVMLTDINTSTAVVAVEGDGTPLGYSTVTDADLTFTNISSGKSQKIHIPNPDDEFAAVDLLGQTLRGRVDSIELYTGDPSAAYQKQKAIRRQQSMSKAFNILNSSKSDENATSCIAFSKGDKYYIVGRHEEKPVMVELELNF